MKQLARMERSKREVLMQDQKNEQLRKEYSDFRREQIEFEYKEYALAADAYPTDMRWKFEMGKRLFSLSNFLEAIPVLQHARNDPKFRTDAGLLLGLVWRSSPRQPNGALEPCELNELTRPDRSP